MLIGKRVAFVPPYGLRTKEMSDSHYAFRALLLARKLSGLRARALAVLNGAWSIAGNQTGFKAQVAVDGYPSIATYDSALEQLRTGEISPKDAMAFT
jgi:hypothetical protein